VSGGLWTQCVSTLNETQQKAIQDLLNTAWTIITTHPFLTSPANNHIIRPWLNIWLIESLLLWPVASKCMYGLLRSLAPVSHTPNPPLIPKSFLPLLSQWPSYEIGCTGSAGLDWTERQGGLLRRFWFSVEWMISLPSPKPQPCRAPPAILLLSRLSPYFRTEVMFVLNMRQGES